MKKLLLVLLIMVITVSITKAQTEAAYWYFGKQAGMEFCNGYPVVNDSSIMTAEEGCAVASDGFCNLLFYTNGLEVYNVNRNALDKPHQIMFNGDGLHGDQSATQSAIIVPHPGDLRKYYVFTVDADAQPYGLEYNIVDMGMNGVQQLGGIPNDGKSKNMPMFTPSTEKVSAVRNANGETYWLLAHEWNNDIFRVYPIDQNGLDVNNYKTFAIGTPHLRISSPNKVDTAIQSRGYMKFSPNGQMIALAIDGLGVIEVFDFNNKTGDIKDLKLSIKDDQMTEDIRYVYGIEFSPDSRFLYFSTLNPNQIFQVDLENYVDPATSITRIAYINESATDQCAALQLAPDGKIYVANAQTAYLGVINQPNLPGVASDYVKDGFLLDTAFTDEHIAIKGLPNYLTSLLRPETEIQTNAPLCTRDSLMLDTKFVNGAEYKWEGPDGWTSDLINPKRYNVTTDMAGWYRLTVTVNGIETKDSVDIIIDLAPYVTVDKSLGDTVFICYNDSALVTAFTPDSLPYDKITWSNGDEGSLQTYAKQQGYLVATVSNNNGCIHQDSIYVKVHDLPEVNIVSDTNACEGSTVALSYQTPAMDHTFEWLKDGTTISSAEPQIDATESGIYTIVITDSNGCVNSQDINVDISSPHPQISGGPILCMGGTLDLSADQDYTEYLWSPGGQTTKQITVDQPGTYTLTVKDYKGCNGEFSTDVDEVNFCDYFPDDIYLGRFPYGSTNTVPVTITNDKKYNVKISNVYLKDGSIFKLNNSLQDTYFNVNNSINLNFEVTTQDLAEFKDVLVIEIDSPCVTTCEIPVRAIGTADLLISVPQDSTCMFDSTYCINVTARMLIDGDITYPFSVDNIEFTFDRTNLLHIDTLNMDENIKSFDSVDSVVVVNTGKIDNIQLSKNEVVIARICGLVLFGKDKGPITFTSIERGPDSVLTVKLQDGYLDCQGYCKKTQFKPQLFEPLEVKVAPNPSEGNVEMTVYCSDEGTYQVEIYNMQGGKESEYSWVKQNSLWEQKIPLDVSNIPSGVYRIIITTAGQKTSAPLYIIK